MKIPMLLLLAWTAQQSEAREVFQIARSLELRPSGAGGLRWQAVFRSQIV
jgi:hypothetical protein